MMKERERESRERRKWRLGERKHWGKGINWTRRTEIQSKDRKQMELAGSISEDKAGGIGKNITKKKRRMHNSYMTGERGRGRISQDKIRRRNREK